MHDREGQSKVHRTGESCESHGTGLGQTDVQSLKKAGFWRLAV
jgi:hypothetical protein